MTTPRAALPSLRAFLGSIACRATTSTSTNLGLHSLEGALTESDQDVQDVVNAIVTALDPIGARAVTSDSDATGATFQAALTAAALVGGKVVLKPGTHVITTDVTGASNVVVEFMPGAVLDISSTKTVTLAGPVVAAGAKTLAKGLGTLTVGFQRNAATQPALIKIMRLGDSMTGSGVTVDAYCQGYGVELQRLLRASRDDIQWIGNQWAMPYQTYRGIDGYHEGHPGYLIEELTSGRLADSNTGYPGWVATAGQPDVVVVSAGTNNWPTDTAAQCLTKMGTLLDTIRSTSPQAHIVVWSPPPSPNVTYDAVRVTYVAGLEEVARSRGASYVDAGSEITKGDKQAADSPAFTHPNVEGHAKIGRAIADHLERFVLPAPRGRAWPRSYRLRAAQASISFAGGAGDYVRITESTLEPVNSSNFSVAVSARMSALGSSTLYSICGYGNDYTEGFLLAQYNGTCTVYFGSGAPKLSQVASSFTVNTWHRILLHYDATAQILSLWIDGTFRYRATAVTLSHAVTGRVFALGAHSSVNAITGIVQQLSVCRGSSVPSFANARAYVERDYYEGLTLPGRTAHYPCSEGSGTTTASDMGGATSAAFGGSAGWSASGAVPTPWDG